MKIFAYRFILVLIALILTACAHTPRPSLNTIDYEKKTLTRHELQRWRISGRIGIKEAQRGFSAYLDWQQTNTNDGQLILSGVMGAQRTILQFNVHGASLTTGKQKVYAATPTALIKANTGYTIPFSALSYWVRDLPQPGHPYHYLNKAQRQQNGWLITISKRETIDGLSLPKMLSIEKGALKIKLLIQRWQI